MNEKQFDRDRHFQERQLAIRVTMMPKDTNAHGTIFGGILLSYLDLAGAIAARGYCERVVTVKMTEVIFHEPVYVGDVVSFFASVTHVGRTSITTHVSVEADRYTGPHRAVKVTDADIVYVNVDAGRRQVPIERSPG